MTIISRLSGRFGKKQQGDDDAQFDGIADQFIQTLKGLPSQADNTYLTFGIADFDGFMPSAIYHRTNAKRASV